MSQQYQKSKEEEQDKIRRVKEVISMEWGKRMKKKISFEIETDKDNGMIEAYLKYSLKMLKIGNIKIEKQSLEEKNENK